MRKGDINNHIAEHCRLTTLTRSDEGLSDDYPALEKVHVRFSDSYVYADLIIGLYVYTIDLEKKLTGGGGGRWIHRHLTLTPFSYASELNVS